MSSKQALSSTIILTEEEKDKLIKLGGLRWTLEDIATFFGWSLKSLEKEMKNPDSEVRACILKGELQVQFALEDRLRTDAVGGNLSAVKQFSDNLKDRSFKMTKLDLFGGSEDPQLFEDINKYIESGCPGRLSDNEQLKLNLLQMIYSFNLRYGDRKTIRFLTREPYNLSYDLARNIMSEAVELLNPGRNTSKTAMRFHMAGHFDTLYHAILESAKSPQDYALAAGILDKKAKILQLDQPDIEVLPPQNYVRQFSVLTLEPKTLGLPPANRDILAAQIDGMDIPASDKARLRMEAGITDVDIIKMIDNVVEEES
jgi:hypothetical protein